MGMVGSRKLKGKKTENRRVCKPYPQIEHLLRNSRERESVLSYESRLSLAFRQRSFANFLERTLRRKGTNGDDRKTEGRDGGGCSRKCANSELINRPVQLRD